MNNLFTSASLKLTGWYLLILMVISLLFSTILYGISSNELKRGLRQQGPSGPFGSIFMDSDAARILRETRYEEGITRIISNLVVLNVATLLAGGGISYFLARKTLEPIERAVEAQGRFTSDASHELRTPLTVMQSEIEIGLREKHATKKDYQLLLESNLDEVHRLRDLSDRLLQLSTLQVIELSSTHLDDVAIAAVSHIVKPAQAKDIEVINNVKPIVVQANQQALADALTVLLDNAIKYSPHRTKVTVESHVKAKSVFLDVIDEGSGIAKDDMPYIFDRFYRADSSRSRQHVQGYGLGLSIARRIVEQHGGELSVASKVEAGATFTIRLPLS